jgi:hypothetical protein
LSGLCPGAGGQAWHELTSAHVRLRTDLEGWAAAGALDELEASSIRVRRLFVDSGDDPPLRAVLFDHEDDFRALGLPKWANEKVVSQDQTIRAVVIQRERWKSWEPWDGK